MKIYDRKQKKIVTKKEEIDIEELEKQFKGNLMKVSDNYIEIDTNDDDAAVIAKINMSKK